MNNVKLEKTCHVIVVDYDEDDTLFNCCLLGWDCKEDWFSTDTYGEDIMTSTGRVKKNKWGLIEIDRWVSVYVSSDTLGDLVRHCDSGNSEGYSCTVCRLEKRDDDYDLIPVYGDCFYEDDEEYDDE